MKMKKTRDWRWAYRKIRRWGCYRHTAVIRATLYMLRGDTGVFWNALHIQRYRITHPES